MIEATSRYAAIPVGTISVTVDGEPRPIRYVRRRFIPTATEAVTVLKHTVTQGNRVDGLAAFYYTDPLQFWRICDANKVMHPHELVDTIGRSLAIVLPLR